HGINVFIGNEFDNHFVIGRSGATIYPGKGSNVITIPNKINDFFIAKIILDADSLIQYVQLDFPVNNIRNIIRHSDKIVLYLRGNHGASVKHIEFHGDKGGNIYDYLGKIVMYTLDGIELELSTNKVRPVVAAKIDIPKFEKHHRDIGVLEPLNILENNSLFFFKDNVSEFDFGNYRVVSSQDMFIYKVTNPGAEFYISSGKSSHVFGEGGCHYYFNGVKQPSHLIFLNNDNRNPETINVSSFTDTSEEVKIFSNVKGNKCTLKFIWSYGSFELTLRPKSSSRADLNTSETKISLSNDALLLRDIFELSKQTSGDVLIYNTLWQYH
ncbi:DUF3491 domain-containing protein, partial [Escherichia coli]|nr:DUF3491 domain-containing protein [Escherichia coli]